MYMNHAWPYELLFLSFPCFEFELQGTLSAVRFILYLSYIANANEQSYFYPTTFGFYWRVSTDSGKDRNKGILESVKNK